MKKTCFVIMGYGIKNNLNLDLTYEEIIKPCIVSNKLDPFPLYEEEKFNAYRCDEISGTTAIDYKFVTCLNGADVVIADISTMNINAIYELGARHALKPRSTILLCSKDKKKEFDFFDITYVPIIFYEHNGMSINKEVVIETKKKLNDFLNFAINTSSIVPDSPIFRALNEKNIYEQKPNIKSSIYHLYQKGRLELDNNEFEKAINTLDELYVKDPNEENLLLLILAKYKIAEKKKSCKELIECINFIIDNTDVSNSTSEYLFGRLGAISLRIYNISNEIDYYYLALNYYRYGANYCKKNLYCPRNYCALLLRIYEITDDPNIITEYYYTAKHYAKLFLDIPLNVTKTGTYDERIYYIYNVNDLKAIIDDKYNNFEKMIERIQNDPDISIRQRETILEGISKLNKNITEITTYITQKV